MKLRITSVAVMTTAGCHSITRFQPRRRSIRSALAQAKHLYWQLTGTRARLAVHLGDGRNITLRNIRGDTAAWITLTH